MKTLLRLPHLFGCALLTLPVVLYCAHSLVRGETEAPIGAPVEAVTIRAALAQSW
jgi:hypothetical protein